MMNLAKPAQQPPGALPIRSEGHEVGWIDGDTITVRGYRDLTTVAHAAWVAYQAIARRLARRRDGGMTLPDIPEASALSVADTQGYRRLLGHGRELARIRIDDSAESPARFGFEVRVPPPTDAILMGGLALRATRSLVASGFSPSTI